MSVGAVPVAPPGFTEEQWETFRVEGMLTLPDRLSSGEVARLIEAVEQVLAGGPAYRPDKTYKASNVVCRHPALTELIDHPRHVGYVYDVYGDHLKLIQSEAFLRPPGSFINEWHFDGPRVVPYRALASVPLKIRVAYWLTDLPRPGMGNLVYVPGSHRPDWPHEYFARADYSEQQVLCCPAGTVTLFDGNLWHRVQANTSDVVRKNLFVSYSPSWVVGYYEPPDDWVATLDRQRRIIMRPYGDTLKSFTRPPAEDLPLYRPRPSDPDVPVPPEYAALEEHKRRRPTKAELLLREPVRP